VQGYGAGTVTAFNRVYGKGASSHTIEFAEFGSCKIKLQRKTNRDPDKVPWLIGMLAAVAAPQVVPPSSTSASLYLPLAANHSIA